MGRPRKGSVNWNKSRRAWIARLDWTDDDGKKQCRKRQAENKSAGLQMVRDWIRELEDDGKAYLDADRMTFAGLAEEYQKVRLIEPIYRDEKKVEGLRDWKGQRHRLREMVAYFGPKRIRTITAGDIEKYRSRRLAEPTRLSKSERSLADVNRSLSLLRTVLNFAVENGWLIRNPFSRSKGIISLAQESSRDRVLSTVEQRRLLQACQQSSRRHIFPLVLTALDSGCRRGELLKLTWRNIDLGKGTLRVQAMNAKSNKERVIDLELLTINELRKLAQLSGGRSDELVFGIKDNFSIAFRSAMREAEIEGARFHDLRATAITFWLARGMQTAFAMRRSGHADQKVFMRYVRMCEEVQQRQRETLREWDLAVSLAELAGSDAEISVSEMVN